ncbi:uncharacterized protein LOC114364488 [Ostrinia furnacalis]|uniref:uncharacterized protein LOC114364488 n=1 Tax=Ostrinia furnacalis TaxID=93504 RepID=UPI0010409957|nr:uncharacterized protein LOC114364488 [Ostrinia furnacalis]
MELVKSVDTPADPNSSINKFNKNREVTVCAVKPLDNLLVAKNFRVTKLNYCCKNQIKESSEKILPKCYRKKCRRMSSILRNKHYNQESVGTKKHKSRRKRRSYKIKKNHSQTKYSKRKQLKEVKKNAPKVDEPELSLSLSSISDSPSDGNISYEDISSDSFTSNSDSKIDTLIKRTKERERRMSGNNFEKPLYASSPLSVVSSVESGQWDGENESINSLETYVLERQDM